jgi:hypothetical protein
MTKKLAKEAVLFGAIAILPIIAVHWAALAFC